MRVFSVLGLVLSLFACSSSGPIANGGPTADGSSPDGGTGGTGEAGDARTPNACKETEADPDNCGACGRSCRGASCVAGLCLTQKVVPIPAPVVTTAAWLLVDDDHLYGKVLDFANVARIGIWSASKSGGEPAPLLMTRDAAVSNYAALDGSSMFLAGERVLVMPKAGGAVAPFGASTKVGEMVANHGGIYWSAVEGLCKGSASAPGAGCTVIAPPDDFLAQPGLDELTYRDLATDGTNVYFRGPSGSDVIRKVPVGGGAISEVATLAKRSIRSIKADGKYVYVLSKNSLGAAFAEKAPVAGGPLVSFGPVTDPGNLFVDDRYVYWGSGKETLAAPVGGGPSVSVGACVLLALDSEFLYCADDSYGIVKLAKL